jgi:hypothetical protein
VAPPEFAGQLIVAFEEHVTDDFDPTSDLALRGEPSAVDRRRHCLHDRANALGVRAGRRGTGWLIELFHQGVKRRDEASGQPYDCLDQTQAQASCTFDKAISPIGVTAGRLADL